tara:strand:- start:53 stop:232 length:180 start_codon:yes stop_codon:yes gene_type:complete
MQTKTKPQKTIHISFDEDNEDIYFSIMSKSTRTNIPVSSLCRSYMRQGIENAQGILAIA